MDSTEGRTGEASGGSKAKKPRTTTACNRCRTKRGRCDGQKPICGPCQAISATCEYELGGDKRKPYTKAVVQAMQLRIDTLEAELAALRSQTPLDSFAPSVRDDMHVESVPVTKSPLELLLDKSQTSRVDAGNPPASGPTSCSFVEGSAPQVNPNPDNVDTFQGGLAINAHGELRFYGPTSSYRAVLADSTSSPNSPDTVDAIRAFSLTRAPIPTALPAEPALPRRPPDLEPDFKVKLLKLAFEYSFAHYNIVPERQFFADLQRYPFERTQFYSPFLLNVVLAVGCRYLKPEDDYPPEICGLLGDFDTRGDVFTTWSRYLLDQEWYNPTLSTIRGLIVLGLYLAGRGFDGPCFMFIGLALKLTEDIGRSIAFLPEMIDTDVPPIVADLDFDAPMYRSSAFHWASRLIFIASKVMTRVYSLKPGISLAQRQAQVPELHLLLESWYHELPSHLRASGSDPLRAPHPHILALNMALHMTHISLHRPFFRRRSVTNPTTNVSTEKCLIAASHIVRLVKLLRGSAGLRLSAPGVQHAAFNAGTVLAISAVEDGISDTPKQDAERRIQAKKDLRFIVASLKEIGTTWTTAWTSAGVLEALMCQWEAASSAAEQPPASVYAPSGSPVMSPTSNLSEAPFSDPKSDTIQIELSAFGMNDVQVTDLTALNDELRPNTVSPPTGTVEADGPTLSGNGTKTPVPGSGYHTPSRGLGFGWLSSRSTGAGDPDGGAVFGASSLPFMFPSWDLEGDPTATDDFMSLLNTPGREPSPSTL